MTLGLFGLHGQLTVVGGDSTMVKLGIFAKGEINIPCAFGIGESC